MTKDQRYEYLETKIGELEKRIFKYERAEEALRESEERFRVLFEFAPDAYYLNDLQGTFVDGNKAAEKMIGYDKAELIGKNFLELRLFAPDQRQKAATALARNVEGKATGPDEFTLLRKDGTQVIAEISTFPVTIKGKAVVLGIARDITKRKQAEEALRVSEESYRELANSITDVFFAMDKELRYTYWNKASENLTGVSARDAIGKSLLEIFPDTPQTRKAEKAYLDVLKTQQSQTFINEYQLGGKDFFFEISAYPSSRGLSVFVKDVTERKQAEDTIQSHVKRLEVINDVHHAILNANSAEQIVTCSLRHIPKLFPCVRASVAHFDLQAGKAVLLGVYANCKTKIGTGTELPLSFFRIAETLQHGKIGQIKDVQALTRRSLIYQTMLDEGVLSCVNIPLIAHGNLVGSLNLGSNKPGPFFPEHLEPILQIANPIAVAIQQALQLTSLAKHREQLRFLTKRLLEAEESERRLLARELHDQAGRNLTALGLNLNILSNYLSPEGKALLNDSLSLLEETTRQIREVMVELRPPTLEQYGLAAALRFCADQFSKRTRLPVVDNIQLAGRLPPTVENAFFRITQEALNNIAKHAEATQAILVLEEKESVVRLSISDDGKGFDPAGITQQQPETKWGLLSMRERAIAVGARLDVKAQTGKGTEILVEWPHD
jgi:PAS domain S-box-containing protein